MTDQSPGRKEAPLYVTQFNVHAEGKGARLKLSFHNMHVWREVVERIESRGLPGWAIDRDKSPQGSVLEVSVPHESVMTVVDKVHDMNILALRHS